MAEHRNKRPKVSAETEGKMHGSRGDPIAVGSSSEDDNDVPAVNTDPPVDRGPYPQFHHVIHNVRMGTLQRHLQTLHREWHRRDDYRPHWHAEPLVAPTMNTAAFVEQLRFMADHFERMRMGYEREV